MRLMIVGFVIFLSAMNYAVFCDAQKIPEPIKSLINRPSQIGTGIFEFRIESGIVDGKNEWLEKYPSQYFSLAVDGTDWVRRFPNSNHIRLNRNGVSASYYQAGMGTPTANQRLTLGAHEGSVESGAGEAVWKMCRVMGAIPVPSISHFISKTPPTLESQQEIEGVKCLIYEYRIPKSDIFEVLTSAHKSYFDAESLTLRLALAEEYGYGLVRLEVLGPLGSYEVTESRDFVEVAPAVFLPKHWQRKRGPETGAEKSSLKIFELVDFKYVNQELPEDTFAYEVPAGTSVTDSRPGAPMRQFDLDSQIKLSSLLGNDKESDAAISNEVIAYQGPDTIPLNGRQAHDQNSGATRILLIVNGVAFFILIIALVWRYGKGTVRDAP